MDNIYDASILDITWCIYNISILDIEEDSSEKNRVCKQGPGRPVDKGATRSPLAMVIWWFEPQLDQNFFSCRYALFVALYHCKNINISLICIIDALQTLVHIHWASHVRDQLSHARPREPISWYTYLYSIFFKNYHNIVKKYSILMYTI